MVTEYASGAVVYEIRDGKIWYLLLQSATSDFWGLPKGHVEKNENLIQTAVREIHEETSLKTQIDANFKEKVEYDMNNGHHKDVTFFVSRVAPEVKVRKQDEEINSFGWFDYEDAYEKLTYDNLRQLLKHADTYIRNKENIEEA
ncbi:bis(5'-nucleosyl)-tetraphosphatase [Lentilactobacillus buchneri]|uniref:Bis(5'-nucleosyl)-tetraphosphatase [asymmetrical] n=1 Tax=Lentilactobacillus buchneri DSM 20057 TaxID=1423728 RepID=A0A4R5NSN8_LENBU|nr:NUDIX domain-containing protein [Lentilactobacillus buchneri]WCJ52354.1 NUDIX domain-containing protein [Lentilactobacillus sp. Egmn17]AEB74088.1 NUDIX hydrolase [Lentilactobacillus buchneri NRRL B-30929]MCT2881432.1 NUDIX domain-containing protein [Lentilactobacillus buchneri]MCT2898853.1 NUDIX domain-containing protein [Lentilactobacillus buchneri]MCT3252211.1 NUDIX domain-containing protein [Lentilactobacillus buchneri]